MVREIHRDWHWKKCFISHAASGSALQLCTAAAHAVLLLDRAGSHTTGELNVPNNITLLFLPSCIPELKPVETLWQFLRQTYLANGSFETYQGILDGVCEDWIESSIGLGESYPSVCANGPTTVNPHDRWYWLLMRRGIVLRSGGPTGVRHPCTRGRR